MLKRGRRYRAMGFGETRTVAIKIPKLTNTTSKFKAKHPDIRKTPLTKRKQKKRKRKMFAKTTRRRHV